MKMAESGFDALIDRLALNLYQGTEVLVGIDALPFWIKRELARHRKIHGSSPTGWTTGQPFETEEQEKIEKYFLEKYPKVHCIGFLETQADADDLTKDLVDFATKFEL